MVNLWIALALGVIFIIITVVVMGTLGVNMFGKMLKGFFSMALKVGVIALFVYWLVEWDSFVFDVLFVIAMLFYSAIEVKVRARLRSTSYVIPVLAILLSALLVSEIPMFAMKFGKGLEADKTTKMLRSGFIAGIVCIIVGTIVSRANWSLIVLLTFIYYIILNVGAALLEKRGA